MILDLIFSRGQMSKLEEDLKESEQTILKMQSEHLAEMAFSNAYCFILGAGIMYIIKLLGIL